MTGQPQAPAAAAPRGAQAMGEPLTPLVLRGVRYRYAGARSWALDGIDLEVRAGEVVGVVGANESGKSTLCLVAAGLAPAVVGGALEGSVRLLGRETRELRPYEAAQRAGIVFQDAGTQLSGTASNVWEEVAFGPRNLGLPLDEVIERVDDALTAVGVAALGPRDPGHLSGGQAQLVSLAAVLAMRPACLVLDEPTSQLDPRGTALVGEAIARLAREAGTAVLLVEHKTGLLARLADRVVALRGGRQVRAGEAAAVLGDPALEELGVEPPPAVRLRAAVLEAGLDAAATDRALEALEALRTLAAVGAPEAVGAVETREDHEDQGGPES